MNHRAENLYNALLVVKFLLILLFVIFLDKMTSRITKSDELISEQILNYNELRIQYQSLKETYHINIENDKTLYNKEKRIDDKQLTIVNKTESGFWVDYYWYIFIIGILLLMFLTTRVDKKMKKTEGELLKP